MANSSQSLGVSSLPSDVGKKIFATFFLNNFRVVGCVDTGSDLTIMHNTLFKKLFPHIKVLHKSNFATVTCFDNMVIPIKGKITCILKCQQNMKGFTIDLQVVGDIPNVPSFLLGSDSLKTGLATISYIKTNSIITPLLSFSHPHSVKCLVHHQAPRATDNCTALIHLKPLECHTVKFMLNTAAQVIRTDWILITNKFWDTVNIVPSRTELEFSHKDGCYIGFGNVINLHKQASKQ